MRTEIRDRWADALESGNYPQGGQHLALRDMNDVMLYCCLGVLCELAAADGVVEADGNVKRRYGPEREGNYLPEEVIAWAGLDANDPEVQRADGRPTTLSRENDAGTSFRSIAKLIREQL